MATFGTPRGFRSGETLVREGEKGNEMFVIRSGRVRVYKGSGAESVTLALLGPGDYIGEMSLVGDYPRSATAIAETNTEATVVDRTTFRAFVSEPIVLDIIRRMSDRIRELDKSVIEAQQAEQLRHAGFGTSAEGRHWFT